MKLDSLTDVEIVSLSTKDLKKLIQIPSSPENEFDYKNWHIKLIKKSWGWSSKRKRHNARNSLILNREDHGDRADVIAITAARIERLEAKLRLYEARDRYIKDRKS